MTEATTTQQIASSEQQVPVEASGKTKLIVPETNSIQKPPPLDVTKYKRLEDILGSDREKHPSSQKRLALPEANIVESSPIPEDVLTNPEFLHIRATVRRQNEEEAGRHGPIDAEKITEEAYLLYRIAQRNTIDKKTPAGETKTHKITHQTDTTEQNSKAEGNLEPKKISRQLMIAYQAARFLASKEGTRQISFDVFEKTWMEQKEREFITVNATRVAIGKAPYGDLQIFLDAQEQEERATIARVIAAEENAKNEAGKQAAQRDTDHTQPDTGTVANQETDGQPVITEPLHTVRVEETTQQIASLAETEPLPILETRKTLEEAQRLIELQIIENPKNPTLRIKKAELLIKRALLEQTQAVTMHLSPGEQHFANVNIQRLFADAEATCRQGLYETIKTNPELHQYMGFAAQLRGDYRYALRCYNNAIRYDSQNYMYYVNRSSIFELLGQPERALENYNQAIRIDPTNAALYTNRGLLLERHWQPKAALESYQNALAFHPEDIALQDKIQDLTDAIQFTDENKNGVSDQHVFTTQAIPKILSEEEALQMSQPPELASFREQEIIVIKSGIEARGLIQREVSKRHEPISAREQTFIVACVVDRLLPEDAKKIDSEMLRNDLFCKTAKSCGIDAIHRKGFTPTSWVSNDIETYSAIALTEGTVDKWASENPTATFVTMQGFKRPEVENEVYTHSMYESFRGLPRTEPPPSVWQMTRERLATITARAKVYVEGLKQKTGENLELWKNVLKYVTRKGRPDIIASVEYIAYPIEEPTLAWEIADLWKTTQEPPIQPTVKNTSPHWGYDEAPMGVKNTEPIAYKDTTVPINRETSNDETGRILQLANQADDLYIDGKYEEAIKVYDVAIRIEPNNPILFTKVGDALYASGQESAAEAAYKEASELRTEQATLEQGKREKQAEEKQAEMGEKKRFATYEENRLRDLHNSADFLEALRDEDVLPILHLNRAVFRTEEILYIIRNDPRVDLGESGYLLPALIIEDAHERGFITEALEVQAQLIHMIQSDAVLTNRQDVKNSLLKDILPKRGDMFYETKQYKEAIEIYEEALQLTPKDTMLLLHYAKALYLDDQKDQAIKAYTQIKDLEIDHTPRLILPTDGEEAKKTSPLKDNSEYNLLSKLLLQYSPEYYNTISRYVHLDPTAKERMLQSITKDEATKLKADAKKYQRIQTLYINATFTRDAILEQLKVDTTEGTLPKEPNEPLKNTSPLIEEPVRVRVPVRV